MSDAMQNLVSLERKLAEESSRLSAALKAGKTSDAFAASQTVQHLIGAYNMALINLAVADLEHGRG